MKTKEMEREVRRIIVNSLKRHMEWRNNRLEFGRETCGYVNVIGDNLPHYVRLFVVVDYREIELMENVKSLTKGGATYVVWQEVSTKI